MIKINRSVDFFESRKLVLTVLQFLFSIGILQSQILKPVEWSFTHEKLSSKEIMLIFKADIDPGWNVYSYYLNEDAGPIPTMIEFEQSTGVEWVGDIIEEGHRKEEKDPLFDNEVVIKFLSDQAYILKQKIKLTDKEANVSGYLTFMTCDNNRCLPPTDIDFQFELSDDYSSVTQEIESPIVPSVQDQGDPMFEELTPVQWQAEITKTGENKYNVTFNGSIDDGWSIYSYYTEAGGPEPTYLVIETEGISFVGSPIEKGYKKTGPDPLFNNIQVIKYLSNDRYSFTQTIQLDSALKNFQAYISYMACDDEKCLPPTDLDYDFDLVNLKAVPFIPGDFTEVDPNFEELLFDQARPGILATYENPIGDCIQDNRAQDKSMFWMFILGFLGGLLAILTPCVFPMIPLTVSFFTKDTKRKGWWNGSVYALSIVVIYVAIGLLLTTIFGEEALNRLSTNWIANSLFFVIFVLFAFSFFGFYEITLPSSWANKSDRIADRGGLIGIFFMAFTLALVSFSCTGPIIGSAIVQAASNQVGPFIVMLGFSMALAIPFGLFAAFPAWLHSLPKSGSWMNSVKVVLGFLELALAFKFLSVADMTNHWDFLKYEVFLILWILIFGGLSIYLFGWIKFPHDSPLKKLSIPRMSFAILFSALTVYLCTGFMVSDITKSYRSLKLLSGLAPPANYNILLSKPPTDPQIKNKYPSYSKCANNINCFKDYYDGLAYAKEVNKPILLDHTGYGCVNCRKTEEHIWVDERVRKRLNQDFVLVSLYVDDDKKLETPIISKRRQKKLRNVGNKWADFQIVNFKQNSQPLYIMMTPSEEVLSPPRGYKEGVEGYLDYLNCGLETFYATGAIGG